MRWEGLGGQDIAIRHVVSAGIATDGADGDRLAKAKTLAPLRAGGAGACARVCV